MARMTKQPRSDCKDFGAEIISHLFKKWLLNLGIIKITLVEMMNEM